MHFFARRHFDKVLREGELLGIDKVANIVLAIMIRKTAPCVIVRFILVALNLQEENGLPQQLGHAKIAIGFIGLRWQAKF